MSENNPAEPQAKKYDEIKRKIQNLQAQLESVEEEEEVRRLEKQPLTTLMEWEAPDRIRNQRGRGYYVTISLVFMLAIAFATITEEILLVVALIALLALIYISSSLKPGLVRHEITNKGIKTGSDIWAWNEIRGFWISKRGGFDVLFVDLNKQVAQDRLMLILSTKDPKEIVKVLIKHTTYLNRSQIKEDIVNVFTLGTYQPITRFEEDKKKPQPRKSNDSPRVDRPVSTNRQVAQ
jgi:hypothetical protein